MLRPGTYALCSLGLGLAAVLTAPAARAHPAYGIVCDRDVVYFADLDRETIWRLDPGGGLTAFPTGKHLHRLHLGSSGGLLFDHQTSTSASLWRLDPASGEIAVLVGPRPFRRGTEDRPLYGFFEDGASLLRDAAGASYDVLHARRAPAPSLVRRDSRGRLEVVIETLFEEVDGERRVPTFHFFQAMAWAADGSILLTEGGRLRRIRRSGEVETLGGDPFAGIEGGSWVVPAQDRLLGLAESGTGRVYVADLAFSRVRAVETDGRVVDVYRDGAGWAPAGVTTCGDRVYVLSVRSGLLYPLLKRFGGPRVVRLDRGGKAEVLATVAGHLAVVPFLAATGLALAATAGLVLASRRRRRRGPGVKGRRKPWCR